MNPKRLEVILRISARAGRDHSDEQKKFRLEVKILPSAAV